MPRQAARGDLYAPFLGASEGPVAPLGVSALFPSGVWGFFLLCGCSGFRCVESRHVGVHVVRAVTPSAASGVPLLSCAITIRPAVLTRTARAALIWLLLHNTNTPVALGMPFGLTVTYVLRLVLDDAQNV